MPMVYRDPGFDHRGAGAIRMPLPNIGVTVNRQFESSLRKDRFHLSSDEMIAEAEERGLCVGLYDKYLAIG